MAQSPLLLAARSTHGRAVTKEPVGSKTANQTEETNLQSNDTTTGADGKARGKIIYRLDAAGRDKSGQAFAPDGSLDSQPLRGEDRLPEPGSGRSNRGGGSKA